MRPPGAHFVAEGGGVWTVHFGEVPVGRIVPDGPRFAVQFRQGLDVKDTRHDEQRIAEAYCLGILTAKTFDLVQEVPHVVIH